MTVFPSLTSGCPVLTTPTGIRVGNVIIDQVSPALAQGLLLLDGNCSLRHAAQQYQLDFAEWEHVIDLLIENGLITCAATLTVAVIGTSVIAETIVELLAQENHHVVREISVFNQQQLDCIIVAPATTTVDPAINYLVTQSQTPHLLCLPAPGGASVGPFIFPGITACLGCCDELRQSNDPSWAWQTLKLAATSVTTSLANAYWAAGLAMSQLSAFQRGELPATAQETWQLRNGICYQYLWQPHPECPCQQKQPTMIAA